MSRERFLAATLETKHKVTHFFFPFFPLLFFPREQGAFHAAGLVADCNFGDQHKVHWSRAARTDKGVHALGNVVSLKVLICFLKQKIGTEVRILIQKASTR